MIIDQRLEALARRHEALTLNVELISHSIDKLDRISARSERRQDRLDRRLDRAIAISVREARNEQVRRQAMDKKWTETMEMLKQLLKSRGNGIEHKS